MHTLLRRQLRRYSIDSDALAPGCQEFLAAVAEAYDASDSDRTMLERSLELSSHELFAANAEMRAAGELLRATLNSTADGILAVASDGRVIHANARFAELWHIPAELLDAGDDAALLAHVLDQLSDADAFLAKVEQLYSSAEESLDSVTFKDGRIFERYSRALRDLDGIVGRVWSFRDVTESQRASTALRASEERFRSLVQNSSDMIMIIDADAVPIYTSPSVERIMGYTIEALTSAGILSLVHPDDLARAAQSLAGVVEEKGVHPAAEVRLRRADGIWRHIEMVAANMLDDPAVGGIVYNARDITERVKLEQQLLHQALHDPLTGLANRVLFADRLAHALERTQRTQTPVAVMYVDVDNFKSVNDAWGHGAGDELLVGIAGRIKEVLRPGDTAARFGGDEFTLLLEDVTPRDATATGERIIAALRKPFEVEGRDTFVEVSVGVAVGVSDHETVDGLLRDADAAMYVAKSRGKARVEMYDKSMDVPTHDRQQLLADMQGAIELEQFVVQYQPTFELARGHLVGAEALVRWNHPERGMVPPLEFIPLAEEAGVIQALGGVDYATPLRLECQSRRCERSGKRTPGTAPGRAITDSAAVLVAISAGRALAGERVEFQAGVRHDAADATACEAQDQDC